MGRPVGEARWRTPPEMSSLAACVNATDTLSRLAPAHGDVASNPWPHGLIARWMR